MMSVGGLLRDLRARRGVSLDEIARKTRVAPRYLEALEADAYEDLPAPVFIRGFIRAYCQALGESPHEALSYYDGRDGRVPAVGRPAALPGAGSGEPRTRGAIVVSFILLVVLGMALFTVAFVIRPGDRGERPGGEVAPAPSPSTPTPSTEPAPAPPAATAPAPAPAAPAATPPAAARPTPPAAAPAPRPPVTPAQPEPARPQAAVAPATPAPVVETAAGVVSGPYRLVARISEPTWMRVRTDDGRTSEETLGAGEVREWVSDRPFVVTIGNAGGVALELNGRSLPSLGARGVVVQRLVLPPEAR
jgi:cytoskeleton protein RodZ